MLAPFCFLLAATAIAGVHSEICQMKSFGNTSDFPILVPVLLRTVTLSPPIVTWDLDLPQWCSGYSGVLVRVCDSDAEPEVRVSSLRRARVVRTGDVQTVAKAHVTQYCNMWHGDVERDAHYNIVAKPSD